MIKEINTSDKTIKIIQGSSIKKISSQILSDRSFFEINLYYYFLWTWDKHIDNINYGEFFFKKKSDLVNITKIISQPSNVYHKISIIDGWYEYQLTDKFEKIFAKRIVLKYQDILADTYKYKSTDSIIKIVKLIKDNKNTFFKTNQKSELFKKYTINDIMIIASLVEKEGTDDNDKRIISSIIFNRLEKNMKLQIDASTIFAITKGKFKYDRKLNLNDLKIQDDYNTYYINGLPPTPICYISKKTINIILENYKSEYLFYFYNKKIKKHVYSKTYNQHKIKLKKYRDNEK